MGGYKEIAACRICGNERLAPILSLGHQALTGVFPRSKNEKITTGPVDLVRCDPSGKDHCALVQLRQSYDSSEMYGKHYGYHSGLNPSMVRHLHGKVNKIIALAAPKAGDLVIDIGSNDSTLLQGYPKEGLTLIGIDPTGPQFQKHYPEHIQLIPEYFSAQAVRRRFGPRKARVVTSIAMFYDLPSPPAFIREVAEVLADDGVWVLEQSYLPTMLDMNAYDTICHEHLEYYSLTQIKWMLDRAGLKIVDLELNAINGGSFSITAAKASSLYPQAKKLVEERLLAERQLATAAPYAAFAARVREHRDKLRRFFDKARAEKKTVLGYGASTKGNVILQYCGITAADLPCVGEVNQEKFGCFTPGTLIPIVSEAQVRAKKPDFLFVLPWHFKEFIVPKENDYRQNGGRLLFPLPRVEVV